MHLRQISQEGRTITIVITMTDSGSGDVGDDRDGDSLLFDLAETGMKGRTGEIVHKGKAFSGQHEGIITQAEWDAVHAVLATDKN